jgi:hypothetical protein
MMEMWSWEMRMEKNPSSSSIFRLEDRGVVRGGE